MVLDMRNPHQLLAFALLKSGDEWGNGAEIFSTVTDIGDVAQLGERRVRNAKVGSSILLVSTKLKRVASRGPFLFSESEGVRASVSSTSEVQWTSRRTPA